MFIPKVADQHNNTGSSRCLVRSSICRLFKISKDNKGGVLKGKTFWIKFRGALRLPASVGRVHDDCTPTESGDVCEKVASVNCWAFLYKMTLCTSHEPPGFSSIILMLIVAGLLSVV